jgi:hypothetical protein
MAKWTRHVALTRPPTVSVHDDGDVPRDLPLHANVREQIRFRISHGS